MQPDDLARLVDMLESSREATLYAGNLPAVISALEAIVK
jgi:hypothetical protein